LPFLRDGNNIGPPGPAENLPQHPGFEGFDDKPRDSSSNGFLATADHWFDYAGFEGFDDKPRDSSSNGLPFLRDGNNIGPPGPAENLPQHPGSDDAPCDGSSNGPPDPAENPPQYPGDPYAYLPFPEWPGWSPIHPMPGAPWTGFSSPEDLAYFYAANHYADPMLFSGLAPPLFGGQPSAPRKKGKGKGNGRSGRGAPNHQAAAPPAAEREQVNAGTPPPNCVKRLTLLQAVRENTAKGAHKKDHIFKNKKMGRYMYDVLEKMPYLHDESLLSSLLKTSPGKVYRIHHDQKGKEVNVCLQECDGKTTILFLRDTYNPSLHKVEWPDLPATTFPGAQSFLYAVDLNNRETKEFIDQLRAEVRDCCSTNILLDQVGTLYLTGVPAALAEVWVRPVRREADGRIVKKSKDDGSQRVEPAILVTGEDGQLLDNIDQVKKAIRAQKNLPIAAFRLEIYLEQEDGKWRELEPECPLEDREESNCYGYLVPRI